MQHETALRSATSLSLLLSIALAGACASTQSSLGSAAQGSPGNAWTDRLVDPVTSPITFETPVIHTSIKPLAMLHEFPDDSVFAGGEVQIYALQGRYAVNERIAIIATKDGHVDLNPDAGSDESGLADIAGGVKYAWIDDPQRGLLVTPGLIFETTSGDDDVLQGNGDGVLRPFISAGLDRDEVNYLGSVGFNLPLDDEAESTSFDWHLHASYEVNEKLVPLIEINGIHYVSGGNTVAANFEGVDVVNLGAVNVAGNDIITGAVGLRYRLNRRVQLGVGYEAPLTAREDIFDNRFTIDAVILF